MDKLTLKDISLKNKKVLMRVDFNVPLKEDGTIADDSRIVESLPSIKYVLEHEGSLILMSHLGRPKNKTPSLSLAPCAKRLSKLLHLPVIMAPDCIGPEVEKLAKELKPKEILLLENLRFYEAEESPEKDPSFAKKLASLGEIYVDDAFGTAHRKHSSTYTIAKYFPQKALCGFLLEKEITYLGSNLKNPKKPFFAIIGGAKISSKIGVIDKLIDKVDELFIGGAMAYTFLKAKGISMGKSPIEENEIPSAKKILDKCSAKAVHLNLPLDLIVADDFKNDAHFKTVLTDKDIPSPFQGMDIGPKTIEAWSKKLKAAATIFWNGPLGVYEMENFAKGTKMIAKALADSSAITIVGGGDSVAAINSLNLKEKFTHLSTGGGASLEYIEYGTLPGIEALSNK
jgi:phosphoglycerate kinase